MRRHVGAVTSGSAFVPGDHICWTYRTSEEHRRVLTAYLLDGLAQGQRVAYFGHDGSTERVVSYLKRAGRDVDALVRRGALVLGEAEHAYLRRSVFDPDARLGDYRALVEKAIADGFTAFRVAAEAAWLLADPEVHAKWPGYELRADRLASEIPFIALCAFDAHVATPEVLEATASVHAATLNIDRDGSSFHVHAMADGAIAISGEIDAASSGEVFDAVAVALSGTAPRIIDVTDLRFADVAAMRALGSTMGELNADGNDPIVRGASPMFRRLWTLMELDRTVPATFV